MTTVQRMTAPLSGAHTLSGGPAELNGAAFLAEVEKVLGRMVVRDLEDAVSQVAADWPSLYDAYRREVLRGDVRRA